MTPGQTERDPVFEVKESTPVRSDFKTLVAIITAVVVITFGGAIAWAHAEAQTTQLEKQVASLQSIVTPDHDITTKHSEKLESFGKTLEKMDAKLDRLLSAQADRATRK